MNRMLMNSPSWVIQSELSREEEELLLPGVPVGRPRSPRVLLFLLPGPRRAPPAVHSAPVTPRINVRIKVKFVLKVAAATLPAAPHCWWRLFHYSVNTRGSQDINQHILKYYIRKYKRQKSIYKFFKDKPFFLR